MAEAVAGLLASAFVSIAKDKLGSAIAEQANLLWNFGGDLEGMKDALETISAALEDAERRSRMLSRLMLYRSASKLTTSKELAVCGCRGYYSVFEQISMCPRIYCNLIMCQDQNLVQVTCTCGLYRCG